MNDERSAPKQVPIWRKLDFWLVTVLLLIGGVILGVGWWMRQPNPAEQTPLTGIWGGYWKGYAVLISKGRGGAFYDGCYTGALGKSFEIDAQGRFTSTGSLRHIPGPGGSIPLPVVTVVFQGQVTGQQLELATEWSDGQRKSYRLIYDGPPGSRPEPTVCP